MTRHDDDPAEPRPLFPWEPGGEGRPAREEPFPWESGGDRPARTEPFPWEAEQGPAPPNPFVTEWSRDVWSGGSAPAASEPGQAPEPRRRSVPRTSPWTQGDGNPWLGRSGTEAASEPGPATGRRRQGRKKAAGQDGPEKAAEKALGKPSDRASEKFPGKDSGRASEKAPGKNSEKDPETWAREVCLRALERGPRTRAQLADALRRKSVPDEVAERVLGRFTEVGLIDDEAFAQAWVQSRHAGRGLARKALAAELRRRGVAPETVDEAVETLDPEQEEQTARRLIARKVAATRGVEPGRRMRRLVGVLARKGYPPGLAYRVVREALEEDGADVEDLPEGEPE